MGLESLTWWGSWELPDEKKTSSTICKHTKKPISYSNMNINNRESATCIMLLWKVQTNLMSSSSMRENFSNKVS